MKKGCRNALKAWLFYKYETATPCKVLDVNMLRRTCLFICQIKISFILTR